jgi:hypothetical protein
MRHSRSRERRRSWLRSEHVESQVRKPRHDLDSRPLAAPIHVDGAFHRPSAAPPASRQRQRAITRAHLSPHTVRRVRRKSATRLASVVVGQQRPTVKSQVRLRSHQLPHAAVHPGQFWVLEPMNRGATNGFWAPDVKGLFADEGRGEPRVGVRVGVEAFRRWRFSRHPSGRPRLA